MICLTPHIFGNLTREEKIKRFNLGSREDIYLVTGEEAKQAIANFLKNYNIDLYER